MEIPEEGAPGWKLQKYKKYVVMTMMANAEQVEDIIRRSSHKTDAVDKIREEMGIEPNKPTINAFRRMVMPGHTWGRQEIDRKVDRD